MSTENAKFLLFTFTFSLFTCLNGTRMTRIKPIKTDLI